jgi:hypothetical protein
MIVMEFFDGAVELGDHIDERVIDEACGSSATCGTPASHRDVKPANLMVRRPPAAHRSSSCRSGRRRGARPSTWRT